MTPASTLHVKYDIATIARTALMGMSSRVGAICSASTTSHLAPDDSAVVSSASITYAFEDAVGARACSGVCERV